MPKKQATVLFGAAAVLLFTAGIMVAQQTNHQVVDGDTLWDLAGHYLQNSYSWPLIWEANKDKVQDPHWIYPGQELVIPPLGTSGPVTAPDTVAAQPVAVEPEPEPEPEPVTPKTTMELRRAGHISYIAASQPVVAEALAFASGYISPDEERPMGHFIADETDLADNLIQNDKVHINLGLREGTKPGDKFAVYRVGNAVKHPKTGKSLGKMIKILGIIQVEDVAERSSQARILRSLEPLGKKEAIRSYVEVIVPKNVKPLPVQPSNEGYIVAVRNPDLALTSYKVVYIDKGLADGTMPGDVYEIYRVQPQAADPDRGGKVALSDRVIGTVQVLAVRNNTASAYIAESYTETIKVGDQIRLVKQMPGQ
jgi:hypothetical protein